MLIAPEASEHAAAIRALLGAAVPTAVEADLVDRLRRDGDLALSLVAIETDAVVGYVALSPMTAPMRALGLAPVAVAPDRQRGGIGTRLIRESLVRAKAAGWQAVFVLGDPAYYRRFGFETDAARGFVSPYAGQYFQALSLDATDLTRVSGAVSYAPAFRDLDEPGGHPIS